MQNPPRVAIVGATGAVGVEMLRVMERRNFPLASLRLLASPRSAGKTLSFRDNDIAIEPLTVDSFHNTDLALFSAGAAISRDYSRCAINAGATIIDNSSAFRLVPEVPLVIPEINADDIRHHKGVIANPNCTTAITLMALHPLHRAFRATRVLASSYQAVSGAGARALEELHTQTAAVLADEPVHPAAFPHRIAFNVIPQIDAFTDNGYTREEMKLQNEGRRILHLPTFQASITCVRVPVERAHSIAVTAQFSSPVSLDKARAALEAAPGIRLLDDSLPMPIDAAGTDDCLVGRLRLDCALENSLSFWVCGDQLLKGAALNAIQIAEHL